MSERFGPKAPPHSKKQREAIFERDDFTSQMRGYSEEKGWHIKEGYCADGGETCEWDHVHHEIPRGFGGTNTPENLITVHSCLHVGKCPGGRIEDKYSL